MESRAKGIPAINHLMGLSGNGTVCDSYVKCFLRREISCMNIGYTSITILS